MTEPLRTDPPTAGPSSEAEREARIEELLLSGLDHYFAGKYEQAINIWTRVAFLERGHGRARAYIERARGALAEHQRESEELLHTGIEAYQTGDFDTARVLLTRALAEGGSNETALALLQRLGHLETAAQPTRSEQPVGSSLPGPARPRVPGNGTRWVATTIVSALVAAAILIGALPVASWLAEIPVTTTPAVDRVTPEPLPIVRPVDMRIERARRLQQAGQLREALALLDGVDIADPLRPQVDLLRGDLQRALLETGGQSR